MNHDQKPQSNEKIEQIVEKVDELLEELLEEIDLERQAKSGEKPRKAKKYKIRIDDRYYIVEQHSMTGRELLTLAGKTPPDNFILTEKTKGGGLRTIELNEVVYFHKHAIERFNTLPRQVQEG